MCTSSQECTPALLVGRWLFQGHLSRGNSEGGGLPCPWVGRGVDLAHTECPSVTTLSEAGAEGDQSSRLRLAGVAASVLLWEWGIWTAQLPGPDRPGSPCSVPLRRGGAGGQSPDPAGHPGGGVRGPA